MTIKAIVSTLVLLLPAMGVHAADAEAGKASAISCGACHGPVGISSNPQWPNLAGQKGAYLANQLKAFRSGERKNVLMGQMAAQLSDDDIANIAAYYSGL